jgi:hypothetical protein
MNSLKQSTLSPFALSLSKGISEWAQGRFGKLRTGFDRLSPNGNWNLSKPVRPEPFDYAQDRPVEGPNPIAPDQ